MNVKAANEGKARGKRISVYRLCVTALMAAVMCILGPMSIPIGEVPISFTNLVIYLTVFLIGARLGTLSYVVYLLLGMAGLPVFSGYQGGLAKLVGPTGGYLVGFILMAVICGVVVEKSRYSIPWSVAGMALATLIAYAFGTVWFVMMSQCSVGYALTVCVLPFLVFDFIKIVLAVALGSEIRKRLVLANLLV